MRLRVPASWKDYHTGSGPGQLPDQTKKAAGAALCSSLPLFTRCAEACAGRSIPYKQLSVPQIVRGKMYKPEIPDDVSKTGPRYKNYQKRKDKALDWAIRLDTDQPIDVATQIVTFQPGGFSGWHTHPGPVFFTVRTGTLTVYEGDDPTCTPHVFTAGTGAVEAATNNHIHMVRNETGSVAEAVVTYLVPVGANPLRTDLPNPGNCPF